MLLVNYLNEELKVDKELYKAHPNEKQFISRKLVHFLKFTPSKDGSDKFQF